MRILLQCRSITFLRFRLRTFVVAVVVVVVVVIVIVITAAVVIVVVINLKRRIKRRLNRGRFFALRILVVGIGIIVAFFFRFWLLVSGQLIFSILADTLIL